MILHINEPIDEQHFQGTFQFPNDLDFIGVQTERQCFVDLFNKEIERRNNNSDIALDLNSYTNTDNLHNNLKIGDKLKCIRSIKSHKRFKVGDYFTVVKIETFNNNNHYTLRHTDKGFLLPFSADNKYKILAGKTI